MEGTLVAGITEVCITIAEIKFAGTKSYDKLISCKLHHPSIPAPTSRSSRTPPAPTSRRNTSTNAKKWRQAKQVGTSSDR